jgi:hypothetical protein
LAIESLDRIGDRIARYLYLLTDRQTGVADDDLIVDVVNATDFDIGYLIDLRNRRIYDIGAVDSVAVD